MNTPWARGFEGDNQYIADNINAKEFKRIYKDFGYEEAISRDKSSLSYLASPSKDLWLLMLDTSEYDRNDKIGYPMTNGQISDATLEWIRKCSKLAEEKNAKIVAVMHHNLFSHNYVMHYGFTLDNSEDVYKVFQECGISLALSGHMHIQNIKSRTEEQKTTYDIITSSLIMFPEQYGILKYIPSQGFDYSTSEVDVEGWAVENAIEDPNLTGFEEYSKNCITQASYQKAYELLSKTGGYTDLEKELMANTFSLINRNYFAGTAETIKDEIFPSEGYLLWKNADDTLFLRDYVLSVFPNVVLDNNNLMMPNE
jgi:3',5'-cyclic AMP phosphodiesterase CpdA